MAGFCSVMTGVLMTRIILLIYLVPGMTRRSGLKSYIWPLHLFWLSHDKEVLGTHTSYMIWRDLWAFQGIRDSESHFMTQPWKSHTVISSVWIDWHSCRGERETSPTLSKCSLESTDNRQINRRKRHTNLLKCISILAIRRVIYPIIQWGLYAYVLFFIETEMGKVVKLWGTTSPWTKDVLNADKNSQVIS